MYSLIPAGLGCLGSTRDTPIAHLDEETFKRRLGEAKKGLVRHECNRRGLDSYGSIDRLVERVLEYEKRCREEPQNDDIRGTRFVARCVFTTMYWFIIN